MIVRVEASLPSSLRLVSERFEIDALYRND